MSKFLQASHEFEFISYFSQFSCHVFGKQRYGLATLTVEELQWMYKTKHQTEDNGLRSDLQTSVFLEGSQLTKETKTPTEESTSVPPHMTDREAVWKR